MRDWGDRDQHWRGIESDYVDVRGTVVHLLRRDGAGMPQLLVHGLGGSATNWLDVIGSLAEDGPVVAVDLPGFGRTAPPAPRAARLRPQVKFLGALLDRLGWDRVVLHGNSMGGLLVVAFAAAWPERVERLVLAAPALPPPRRIGALSPVAAARFAPFASRLLGERVMRRLWAKHPADVLYGQTLDIVLGNPEALRPALKEVGIENVEIGRSEPWRVPAFAHAASDVVATLARASEVHGAVDTVATPALLIWGKADRLVSRHVIDAVVARRPDWHRVDLDGVGHVPMLEAPDRYLDAVRSWPLLESLTAATG
jgi:pimeloyl-ACP methyl ester carboxylesterase